MHKHCDKNTHNPKQPLAGSKNLFHLCDIRTSHKHVHVQAYIHVHVHVKRCVPVLTVNLVSSIDLVRDSQK